jgi:diphthamide biosynthesis protein 4
MAYTKDYYRILSLDAPGWRPVKHTDTASLRRAYKAALLAAHPDKKKDATETGKTKLEYTVDDVKEAYTILADPKTRADYDNWFLHNRDTLRSSSSSSASTTAYHEQAPSSDFVLGLELLDLSEFDVVEPHSTQHTPVSSTNSDGEERMEWTRGCRCGADRGFRILEEELEDAEARGENEVLVGCEGCSLWVRVGFDVEEK